MADGRDYVRIFVEIRHETDKAYLIMPMSREIWLAKSIVTKTEECLILPRWLADKEGLEFEE